MDRKVRYNYKGEFYFCEECNLEVFDGEEECEVCGAKLDWSEA